MKSVDVAALIDEGPFTGYQRLLVAATAMMIVLDGADNQLLPNAIPAMMREWGLGRPAFATASAAAPLGMIAGGILGGILGDRIGRRTALLGSVIAFGITTAFIAAVNDVVVLTAVRFLAGLGLGGAMPNAAALSAEYVPKRQRPIAITLTIVCIPLGGFLAGLVAGQVIPSYGWRPLFLFGGGITMVLALVLWTVLPESPRFLSRRHDRWPELRMLLRRIGRPVGDETTFVDAEDGGHARAGTLRALLAPELRRDTVALFVAFGSCLLTIWMGFLWIPAMLTGAEIGFAQADASYALSVFNVTGIGGAIAGGMLIQRFGSRGAMLGMAGLSVISAALLAIMPPDSRFYARTMLLFAVSGVFLNAVQTTMYALAAHVFPTAIRAVGVGTTVAVGRVGNVAASYVGSWALTFGGASFYFTTWAVAMVVVLAALAAIRRHIPGLSRRV